MPLKRISEEFSKWPEHKCSLGHAGMRHAEAGPISTFSPVQQQIKVESSSSADETALTPVLRLQDLQESQSVFRGRPRLGPPGNHRIDKIGLLLNWTNRSTSVVS